MNNESMVAADLLDELKSLCHEARVRRVIELAREPTHAALFEALERGDSFARRYTLYSCYGSRDGARVARITNDESRMIRRFTMHLAPMLCFGQDLEAVFHAAKGRDRRRILQGLRKRGRVADVDRLCRLVARDGNGLAEIVPYASLSLVQESWSSLTNAGETDWIRMARFHPEFTFNQLRQEVEAAGPMDFALNSRVNSAVVGGGHLAPDAAVDLVAAGLRNHSLRFLPFEPLLLHRPEALAQLVLSVEDQVHQNFGRVAHRLRPETLEALLENRPWAVSGPQVYLKRLQPTQRAALYEKFGRGWQSSTGLIPVQLLELLPRPIRHAEARRHLELPTLAAHPLQWTLYAGLLPWDECLRLCEEVLRDPEPESRAAALLQLARPVRFERERATDLLQMVWARKNEQDPVRLAMLTGLASLPPRTWKAEHLPVLAEIARQALDARDLSPATAAQLERLIVRLLPIYPEWASEQISILYHERGQVSFYALQNQISDREMRIMGPYLLPIFQAWSEREHSPLIGAMASLGRRLRVWDEGISVLARLVRQGPPSLASSALALVAEYRPELLDELMPPLLQAEDSWCTQPVVIKFLHQRRQDLLDEVALGRRKPSGRFWGGQTRFLLPVRTGFWRWNPAQQEMFALTLKEVIDDAKRDVPAVLRCVETYIAMPDADPEPLLVLAGLEQERAAVREGVLRALSRLDRGQGVPVLLDALEDERANIAIYSLRRSLLEMPEERAVEILRQTPLHKVTVAKEVVRLLGDLDSRPALELLLEMEARDLHRDVRIALLRAFWEHLEDERVWPILHRSAASEDAAVARMVARTTHPRLSTAARDRLLALFAEILTHPDLRVRIQALQTITATNFSDPGGVLAAPISRSLDSRFPEEFQVAASAMWRVYGERHPELVGQAFSRILPRRRALSQAVQNFLGIARLSPRLFEKAGKAVLEVLASDPLAVSMRLQVAASLFPAEFGDLVNSLDAAGALQADAVDAADRQLRQGGVVVTALPEIEARLADSGSAQLRRLAFAALAGQANDRQGWTEDRKARLMRFRNDPDPMVAAAAQWTFVDATDDGLPE